MAKPQFDPVFLHARREALYILGLFVFCFAWAMGVYLLDGYYPSGDIPAEVALVFGMPRWVFWVILVPWLFCIGSTVWFVFFFMKDDDLGEADGDKVNG